MATTTSPVQQTTDYPVGHAPVHNYLREPAPGPDVRGLRRILTHVWLWMSTLDHKRIGILYLVSICAAFALGGIAALLVRIELLSPDQVFMDANAYNRMFTLHGIVMVFLFILPSIPAALGNIILPLQVGAKDVAFPRLNLFSYYLYLGGACFAVCSIITGMVDTGWTFYTPY